ncbi:STAS/SEC14 domain-containing protein [Muriicola sp. E247]|uniref:STAS/SEC14 domain-containing protein n=1 Tax=Muriicola sp. E247 TaxID=3242730 RepID=UPI0035239B7F
MKVRPIKTPVVIKEYVLEIGTVKVYDNYMVATFNEGSTVTLERAYQVIGISEIHFRDRPFGFISFRKHSYAIDPTIYAYVRELENLKAFAIVSVKEMDMHNFSIEKMFYKKPMKFFIDYNNALAWVKRRVAKK